MVVASAQSSGNNMGSGGQMRTASGTGGVGVARTTKTLGSHYKYWMPTKRQDNNNFNEEGRDRQTNIYTTVNKKHIKNA